MKKVVGFTLFALTPIVTNATCNVRPLTSSELTGTEIKGQIIYGEECRGVSTRAAFTADHYSFQGKVGDTIKVVENSHPNLNVTAADRNGVKTYMVLLDPSGAQIANASNKDALLGQNYFEVKLTASGVYKLVETGYENDVDGTSRETITYTFKITSSSPNQTTAPAPVATCPSDSYDGGKLIINSVAVPNGMGGTVKYRAMLSLQPLANPLTFTLDKAELLQ